MARQTWRSAADEPSRGGIYLGLAANGSRQKRPFLERMESMIPGGRHYNMSRNLPLLEIVMLNLDQQLRGRLRSQQALATTKDGDEVFLGLTVVESVFYLKHTEHPDRPMSTAEKMLYFQLKHRHIVARIAALLDRTGDACGPSEPPPPRKALTRSRGDPVPKCRRWREIGKLRSVRPRTERARRQTDTGHSD